MEIIRYEWLPVNQKGASGGALTTNRRVVVRSWISSRLRPSNTIWRTSRTTAALRGSGGGRVQQRLKANLIDLAKRRHNVERGSDRPHLLQVSACLARDQVRLRIPKGYGHPLAGPLVGQTEQAAKPRLMLGGWDDLFLQHMQ